MESNPQPDLDPNRDDLPLRANTNHMLVRHYVLDLTVHFQREVIGGSIVLFLDPVQSERGSISSTPIQDVSKLSSSKEDAKSAIMPCLNKLIPAKYPLDLSDGTDTNVTWDDDSDDFTLVLDCCDLVVFRVEEVDVTTVSNLKELEKQGFCANADHPSSCLVRRLVSMPSASWRRQQDLYLQCSHSPAVLHEKPLRFHMDQWSLQIRKEGVLSPHTYPCALRIWYETKPTGGSVRWTKDQDGRCCVYTMGSPINNRALFPCQEPPVAMSTWQARVRAPCDYTVLMSGENQAFPEPAQTGVLQWDYYVTMPMPASTFTIAVGQWLEAGVKASISEVEKTEEPDVQDIVGILLVPDVQIWALPVFQILKAFTALRFLFYSHAMSVTYNVHKDSRYCFEELNRSLNESNLRDLFDPGVDLRPEEWQQKLVNWSEIPHIVFLSQSVLKGERNLCGARLCHEIAHSWFGLAIGAQDWTEEWISEGFATYLEDVFWAQVQQLGCGEAEEQKQLKALLRWRRLSDELQNSEEELQVLRPNKENTGEVSESGASVVKHALNPGKPFMQVHYVKGYFLLKFLADQVGEENFLLFIKTFVRKFHGRLILSQDFLQMLLDTFSGVSRSVNIHGGTTLEGQIDVVKQSQMGLFVSDQRQINAFMATVPPTPLPSYGSPWQSRHHTGNHLFRVARYTRNAKAISSRFRNLDLTTNAQEAYLFIHPEIMSGRNEFKHSSLSVPAHQWLTDASSEWLQTPAVEEVREEVGKWIHFSSSCGKGTKRKRAGPEVNFKEVYFILRIHGLQKQAPHPLLTHKSSTERALKVPAGQPNGCSWSLFDICSNVWPFSLSMQASGSINPFSFYYRVQRYPTEPDCRDLFPTTP
ncbi:Aminopeptidase O [Triplophysa tibetana]|uniref:Aminopeptidase O n=1 Tax=Triplophysa tibetana TaxID=1572043 RepID=A0A5A9NYX3_9TELE|nr:Aminopeptidase O [Triplophysa tibetana]